MNVHTSSTVEYIIHGNLNLCFWAMVTYILLRISHFPVFFKTELLFYNSSEQGVIY